VIDAYRFYSWFQYLICSRSFFDNEFPSLSRTALATCRFILSLDPLRDPMGILSVIDRFVISCGTLDALQWFVDIVESDILQILYRDNDNSKVTIPKLYKCGIRDLPNIAFSYALALFKIYTLGDNTDDEMKLKSNVALQSAIGRYPLIIGQILQYLNIDTTGRSFRRDWSTVLDYTTQLSRILEMEWSSFRNDTGLDTITLSATLQSCERLSKNFIIYCSKFWNQDEIQQWVFDNMKEMKDQHNNADSNNLALPKPPSPAIIRYLEFDVSAYDDRITTLPPDVAIIEPELIAQAMIMNTNRARFARHMQLHNRRGGGGGRNGPNQDMDDDVLGENGRQVLGGGRGLGAALLGPPTNMVDPDWPIAEVLWRSFLPWNHVEGVPPPRR
jgi:Transcriptional repressor TCF25